MEIKNILSNCLNKLVQFEYKRSLIQYFELFKVKLNQPQKLITFIKKVTPDFKCKKEYVDLFKSTFNSLIKINFFSLKKECKSSETQKDPEEYRIITTYIKTNPRGNQVCYRYIPVGVFTINFNEKNLADIFHIINNITLNSPYPDDIDCFLPKLLYCKNLGVVYRPNHNGTHSSRSARYAEVLLDLIKTNCKDDIKEILELFSEVELLNIKLASFLLRSGRLDESSHKHPNPDDYYTRSADIYYHYATILNIPRDIITFTHKAIIDSCKPIDTWTYPLFVEDSDYSKKQLFIHHILSASHELDLVRCFNTATMTKYTKKNGDTHKRLNFFFESDFAYKTTINLYNFAIQACKETGYGNSDFFKAWTFNLDLFYKYSTNGKACWELLKSLEYINYS